MNSLDFHDEKSFVVFLLQAKECFNRSQSGFRLDEDDVLHSIQEQSNVHVVFPDEALLPNHSQIDATATAFYAEINSVIYILSSEGFQDCIDRLLTRSGTCSNSHIVLFYAVLSLHLGSRPYFDLACEYLTQAIEEGSIVTVEAMVVLVYLPA